MLPYPQNIRDDAGFYQKLKAEYIRKRGYLKHHFFSWKTCTSIKFIKVKKQNPYTK
jgi:hypothetical protein